MPKREYSGTARPTVLSGAVLAAGTTLNVVDGTGYPTGASGPFIVTIDAGTTSEEKVLCSSRTGNSLTVATGGRGFDGTTASDHSNAASVAHTYSAADAREANDHINDATGDPHPQYLTPAEGAALYSGTSHTHPAPNTTKTIRLQHTISVPGNILNNLGASIPGFFVPVPTSQTARLVKVRHKVRADGSIPRLYILRNFVTFAAANVTTTSTTDDLSQTLNDGDHIGIQIDQVTATPQDLTVSFWFDVTV